MYMKLIYSYSKLQLKLCKMINESQKYVYIFSWDFNIDYDINIRESLINATKRKVHVYIITGGKHENPIDINILTGIDIKYFHLKYKYNIGPKFEKSNMQKLFRAMRILSADFINPYKLSMFFFVYISFRFVYFYSNLYYKHK